MHTAKAQEEVDRSKSWCLRCLMNLDPSSHHNTQSKFDQHWPFNSISDGVLGRRDPTISLILHHESSKKPVTKGIATRSKDATNGAPGIATIGTRAWPSVDSKSWCLKPLPGLPSRFEVYSGPRLEDAAEVLLEKSQAHRSSLIFLGTVGRLLELEHFV